MIRECKITDAQTIVDIYNFYIENSTITFDEHPLSEDEMALRIENTAKQYPWFVYENNHHVVGYAYASPFRVKSAYRFTAESTIYVKNNEQRRGIGIRLYRELIEALHQQSIHCIVGVISLPNDPSIRLHEKLGFEKVAHMKQTGRKFNRWIDVGYWELILD